MTGIDSYMADGSNCQMQVLMPFIMVAWQSINWGIAIEYRATYRAVYDATLISNSINKHRKA